MSAPAKPRSCPHTLDVSIKLSATAATLRPQCHARVSLPLAKSSQVEKLYLLLFPNVKDNHAVHQSKRVHVPAADRAVEQSADSTVRGEISHQYASTRIQRVHDRLTCVDGVCSVRRDIVVRPAYGRLIANDRVYFLSDRVVAIDRVEAPKDGSTRKRLVLLMKIAAKSSLMSLTWLKTPAVETWLCSTGNATM